MVTYNVVDDLGMDDTGSSDNFPIFKNNIGSDVTFEFPPGTYAFGDGNLNGWWEYYDVDNFTMRGADGNGNWNSSHRDAVIQPLQPNGDSNTSHRFGRFRGTNHTLQNLSFNAYDNDITDITVQFITDDNLTIEEVDFWGKIPDSDYTGAQLPVEVQNSNGTGTIDKIGIGTKYGGVQNDYPNHRGISVEKGHKGELTVTRARIEDIGGSAIRNTVADGPVTLKNSYFENVYNAAIRVNSTPDDIVRNCEVRITSPPRNSTTLTAGAIRVDGEADSCTGGGLIENCDIQVTTDAEPLGGIVNRGFSDITDVTVKDTRIEYNNSGGAPLRVLSDACSGYWTVENVAVTGSNPTPVNEKSGELTDCCFPSGTDLSDWTTNNTSTSGGCDTPNFTLMSGSGFWPTTANVAASAAVAPTRNGAVVTIDGAVATSSPLPSYGNTVTIFEDGDISEFSDAYAGGTGDFTVTSGSGWETDGSNALESTNTDGYLKAIISTSGLGNYPNDSDDIYKVDTVPGASASAQSYILYRVQDSGNFYGARIEPNNNVFTLMKWSNQSDTIVTSTSATFSTGTTYTATFDPTGGGTDEFVVSVNADDGTASLTSDTYLAGETGVGFGYNNVDGSSDHVFHDNARLA